MLLEYRRYWILYYLISSYWFYITLDYNHFSSTLAIQLFLNLEINLKRSHNCQNVQLKDNSWLSSVSIQLSLSAFTFLVVYHTLLQNAFFFYNILENFFNLSNIFFHTSPFVLKQSASILIQQKYPAVRPSSHKTPLSSTTHIHQ